MNAADIPSPTLRRDALVARALFSHIAVHLYGLTLTAVARHLGLSVPTIARALRRAAQASAGRGEWMEDLVVG